MVGGTVVLEAALGAAIEELIKAVVKAKYKTFMFRTVLERMEAKLESIIPVVKQTEEFNKVLDRKREETGRVLEQIEKGKNLVLACSRIRWYNACWKRLTCTDKLLELEESLQLFYQIVVQAQTKRDTSEMLIKLEDVSLDLKRIRLQGKKLSLGACSVPEAPESPVGLEVALGELKMELFKEGVSIVVLSAPPGCGKTTLATLLCHDKQVQDKFQDIFYAIVSRQPTSLKNIVRRLFQHKGYDMPWSLSEENVVQQLQQFLKEIGRGPILLVLDDVWPESASFLDMLKFQIPDFKVLVTSRSVFPRFGSSYKLKPLDDEYAMTLFCNAAFPKNRSSDIIPAEVVDKIVKGCKGFPLALKVVGRSLYGQPEEIWRTREMELSKGGTISVSEYSDLLTRLQSSLDALDNDVMRQCFMDLCSFPEDHRIPVNALIDMWSELYKLDEDGVYAVANIHELSNKSLIDLIVTRNISDSYNGYFVMQHDLLRELGIYQSKSESIEQTRRLVVEVYANNFPDWWMERKYSSIHARLISISTDEMFNSSWCDLNAPEAEVLILNFQTRNFAFPEFLEKMGKLKTLVASNYGFLLTDLSNFQILGSVSNLKRFRLEQVSIPSFAFTSTKFCNLQKITIFLCKIGQAFSPRSIQLSEALPNLQEINIDYCNDLVELPDGICDLIKLKKLSITNCHNLVALPEEIGALVDLEVLSVRSCIELAKLPDRISSLHKLRILDVSECLEIKSLPENVGELENLRKLHIIGCTSICELPLSVSKLENLEVICDDETATLWEPFRQSPKNLKIKIHREDVNLNWLGNNRYLLN